MKVPTTNSHTPDQSHYDGQKEQRQQADEETQKSLGRHQVMAKQDESFEQSTQRQMHNPRDGQKETRKLQTQIMLLR